MCRMVISKAKSPILLAKLLLEPDHSIAHQEFDCRLRPPSARPYNCDGFGMGWYDDVYSQDRLPCLFTSLQPLRNDRNLVSLANKVRSKLFFAHLRATLEANASHMNCHPWSYGRLLWMYNGTIPSFTKIKRTLQRSLPDDLFLFVQGNTDGEWAFALFLSMLKDRDRQGSFHHSELETTVLRTIRQLHVWLHEAGVVAMSQYNFAVTDGESVVCSRCSSPDEHKNPTDPPSLYIASGTEFDVLHGKFRMQKTERREHFLIVASEPLTFESSDWRSVPAQTLLVITPNYNVLTRSVHKLFEDPLLSTNENDLSDLKGDAASISSESDLSEPSLTPSTTSSYYSSGSPSLFA